MADLIQDREAYIDHLTELIAAAPSSFHTVHAAASSLTAAGFLARDEEASWAAPASGGRGFAQRDGAIVAWHAGAGISATSPVRVLGCHTDSPGFVLKPNPDFQAEGLAQAGVEVYGSPLMNSWLDRDLGFAGRIVTRSGEEHLVRTGAVARIPQLAIHLDREVNAGLTLDRQRHVQPVIGVAGSVLELLAAAAGIPAADIVGTDVRLHDTQAPARLGASEELYAAPRLDNLSSVAAGVAALIEAEPAPGTIAVFAAFDHEELGSETRTGAAGPFLAEVLGRLQAGLSASADEVARGTARSWCLSADAGHAVHPNYPERHDPQVRPRLGGGPMLKINANQRYSSDAHGAALWRGLCAEAGVPTQDFVSNNTVPCGSTVGPLMATRLGIRTVDVGVPLLSMHSARELAHVDDLHGLARAVTEFYAGG